MGGSQEWGGGGVGFVKGEWGFIMGGVGEGVG